MRTCENCKRVFEDDMKFCPYCGEKYHDYHEELKSVMNDLFDEDAEPEIKSTINEEESVPVLSRVENQNIYREE